MPAASGHATGQTPLAKGQPRARVSRGLAFSRHDHLGTPPTTASDDGGSSSGNGGNGAAAAASAGIIGGAVAGVAVIAAIGVGAFLYMRSKDSADAE